MAYLTILRNLNIQNSNLSIGVVVGFGADLGGSHAMRLDYYDEERSIGRIEIFYAQRPLDERYSRFKSRLDAALIKRMA